MADKKLRIRIGVFVLLSLVGLAILIYLFGIFPNLFRASGGNVYLVEFEDAPNVIPGTPVRRSGVKIGQVEKVDLDEETGQVLVTLSLDRPHVLRRNEEPTLNTGLLSGDTTIDLTPRERKEGQPIDRTVIEPGSRVAGKLTANVSTLINRASAVVPPAQDTLNRIQISLERLEKVIPQVERTLDEYRLLARDSRRTLPELRRTNAAVEKLVKDVNEVVPDTKRLMKEAADTMPDVRALIKSVNDAVPDVRKMVNSITDTMPSARETLRELTIASRNWSMVGERINTLLKTNEDRINNLLKETEQAVANVADTFNQENRNNLTTILRNTKTATNKLPEISDQTELLLRQGRGTLTKMNETLKKVDETFDTLNRSTKPGSPESQGIIKNLSEGLEKFNRTMTDVNELVRVIGRSDGTLRRFIADPSLFNHVDDAVLMVTRMLPRLDRALKDFEVFADKLARHPESLGLGGVVHPSNGIKDPPRSSLYPPRHP